MSAQRGADADHTSIDGDPNPEIEALLSAMSSGVVGVGDRIGRTDAKLLERLYAKDGRLLHPDRPIALANQSFFRHRGDARYGPWSLRCSRVCDACDVSCVQRALLGRDVRGRDALHCRAAHRRHGGGH